MNAGADLYSPVFLYLDDLDQHDNRLVVAVKTRMQQADVAPPSPLPLPLPHHPPLAFSDPHCEGTRTQGLLKHRGLSKHVEKTKLSVILVSFSKSK